MMIVIWCAIFFVFARNADCDIHRKENIGPYFTNEPPSRVVFSNSSGAEIKCSADGVPFPSITWITRDGMTAKDISGIRHVRPDGTLIFPHFTRNSYREEVQNAVYQCLASNSVGSILSREVHVTGAVNQRFNPVVHNGFVVKGNTAVLKCHLPSSLKDIVFVESWIRSDGLTLRSKENKARSYTVLKSGELLIHETQEKDSNWSYRCLTKNKLTGELVTSVNFGTITVTEPHTSTLPRVTFHLNQAKTEEGGNAELPCIAEGNPPPSYRWMKDQNGILKPIKEDGRIRINQGTLHIEKAANSDCGKYQCIVRNTIGERRIETTLKVSAPLVVELSPAHQALNIGQEATFSCNISGFPVHSVVWRKNQHTLKTTERVHLLSRDVLHIRSVRRDDKGMYQCFAFSDSDSAQSTAELKIIDIAPVLVSAFPENIVQPGDGISLQCIATGNPTPQVRWYFENKLIEDTPRFIVSDYVNGQGQILSFLNASDIHLKDSGEYQCHVANEVGSLFHSSRVNVVGPAYIRRMPNLTAIAGEDLVIRCPYGGYPIKEIIWLKGDNILPMNHRQKISHTGSLSIHSVERLGDEGEYTCIVADENGDSAKSTIHITVVVPPVLESHFFRDVVPVDEGIRTKLMCVVTKGDPPIFIQWLKNDQPFVSHGDLTVQTFEDSSILAFNKVSSSDRGFYTCVASNIAASTNLTTQLIVNVPPTWTIEPRNASVVLGNTIWLDCGADGFPAPTILWKKMIRTDSSAGDFTYVHSNSRAHRNNNGTLVLSDLDESDSGSYLCQANNGIGSGLSKIIYLKVLVPPRVKDPYKTKIINEYSDVILICTANGDLPMKMKWLKDNLVLKANDDPRYAIRLETRKLEATSELHITNATRNDNGTYSCHAGNDFGVDEAVTKLIVQGTPAPPSNVTAMNVTSRSVNLYWDVSDNGGSHVTGSIVQYQVISEKEWNDRTSQLIVSGSDAKAVLRGLNPATAYFIRVIVQNSVGKSKPSDVIEIITEEEVPSGPPLEVHIQSTGAHSMKVLWKPPLDELQHGILKGYYVGYKPSSSHDNYTFKAVNHKSKIGQQSTYITELKPFTEYDIVIKSFNSLGAGPDSNEIMGMTLETEPTSYPAYGKRETDVPFYMNVTLVISIVVSSLVLVILILIIIVCLRKQSRHGDDDSDYEATKDLSLMNEINKQFYMNSEKIPYPSVDKTDFEDRYVRIEPVSIKKPPQDRVFATIKRCPSSHIYSASPYRKNELYVNLGKVP